MGTPFFALLYLPVLVWVVLGLGLLLAYGRSASTVVFRLAAFFLAIWALLATTALLWVLTNGGWSGIVDLSRSPLLVFQARYAPLWLAGAVGAFGVFVLAFLLSQVVGRGILALLRPHPMAWPATLPPSSNRTSLLTFASDRPDAFTFTLLERNEAGRLGRHDFILLSSGLLETLEPDEQQAVIAHEISHIRSLDGRYLTFFRTLARTMRWDPVLAILADRLTEREEFRADLDAVGLTGRPKALARALYKVSRNTVPSRTVSGLLGVGGRRGQQQAAERIRRLVRLAESGRYAEEPGA
ncbi:MAG: M56 family metallopeptidase [Thermoplasmata archaeon]|nr:M56 family metallopeptidase [Thermoplasmata archaeon]